EERIEFLLFWQGLRTYLGRSFVLLLISLLGFVVLIANAVFYLSSSATPLKIFGIVWLYAIYFWLSMQPYMLPLLVEQEDKRVRLVLRNSFFLALANVIPTFTVLLICGALFVASVAL